ncbi:HK97-gp10 family putative phage morphogenesis protein [Alteriqipengyuania lutimaris]|nr:HK97-gp10 family putative phage morphogenesis protein [Alteriqipengyuania lutimaris]MBB3034054.1 HK97 gp10 family phage protein [Alteriqipengyuania lutimaris]
MKFRAKIDGFGKLESKIDRTVAAVDGRRQGAALEEAAEPVLARMQQLVPVRSGELRDSLSIVLADDGLSVSIGPVGGAAWRAHFVELGTVNMPAEPFIRPAFDGEKDNMKAVIAGQLRSDILKEARA